MSDKNLSNIPGRITAPTEMLAPAIVELLLRIPDTWQTYRPNDLSETQSQALFLLAVAGMVERRERMRMRMLGDPLVVEATFTATGEYGGVEALMPLVAQTWEDWQDAFRRWQEGPAPNVPPFHCERLEPSEWRLTDQGVIARKDVAEGKEGAVVDFVLKLGFFDGHPRLVNGRIFRREPVRGKGRLERIEKFQGQPAKPSAVEIANWGKGAEVFTAAFSKMSEATNGQGKNKGGAPTKIWSALIAVFLAGFSIIAFEAVVYFTTWPGTEWTRNHGHSIGLQIAFDLIVLLASLSIFVPRLRKLCLITGIGGVVLVVLQII